MKVVGGDSRVFMQPLRPASLYNSWNKGQEFIKPVSFRNLKTSFSIITDEWDRPHQEVHKLCHLAQLFLNSSISCGTNCIFPRGFVYGGLNLGSKYGHPNLKHVWIWCLKIQWVHIEGICGKLHGNHKILPQFYWIGCYFPMFVLTLPTRAIFHFNLDFFFPLWVLSLGGGLFTHQWAAAMVPNPKSSIFPSPLPCVNGYPLPSFTLAMKEKALNNPPLL